MNKIRIKHFDHEIELEGEDTFIKNQLIEFYKSISHFIQQHPNSTREDVGVKQTEEHMSISGKNLTPAEYFKKFTQKNKTEGINQILIFGKYLDEAKGKAEFTQKDINNVVKEARLSKDIHPQYFTNAIKQGLLRSVGKGTYCLTLSAESVFSNIQ
jgi:hypothetical protein